MHGNKVQSLFVRGIQPNRYAWIGKIRVVWHEQNHTICVMTNWVVAVALQPSDAHQNGRAGQSKEQYCSALFHDLGTTLPCSRAHKVPKNRLPSSTSIIGAL